MMNTAGSHITQLQILSLKLAVAFIKTADIREINASAAFA